MIALLKNKKSQFGPDLLIGFLLIAILGLGGVFFLNTFVNSLSLTGLINVLDAETDQECNFMLMPLMGDEYLRHGSSMDDLEALGQSQFIALRYYFPASAYEDRSKEFDDTMTNMELGLSKSRTTAAGPPTTISGIQGYLTTLDKSVDIPNEITNPTYLCSVPVYSPFSYAPFEYAGAAQLFVSTTER